MNSPSDKVTAIVGLLEGVLAGTLSSKDAIEKWPDIDREENPLLKRAWHDLYHFSVDADIQSRDAEYARHQREMLQRRITEICANPSSVAGGSEI